MNLLLSRSQYLLDIRKEGALLNTICDFNWFSEPSTIQPRWLRRRWTLSMWPLSKKMEAIVVDKCLAFCQALTQSNHIFNFSLTMGKDNFTFKKELVQSSCMKVKKSPSQMRREERRKEDRKQSMTTDVTEKVTEISKSVFKCDQCDKISKSEKGLKMHISRAHKTSTETPEKLRHSSLSTSLLLTPSKGERQEMCPNCDKLMSPGHLCEASETEAEDDEDKQSNSNHISILKNKMKQSNETIDTIKEFICKRQHYCPRNEHPPNIKCFNSFNEWNPSKPVEIKCRCNKSCKIKCNNIF